MDDFRGVLEEYRHLALWAVPGAALPFAAHLVSITPPWPTSIATLTAIMQLLALMLVYQLLKGAAKRTISTIMIFCFILLILLSAAYLLALSMFTFSIPPTGERWVKGYECTRDALMVFPNECPWLAENELRAAEYEASRLWTLKSITLVRIMLVVLWLTSFFFLAAMVASFVVFQRDQGEAQASARSAARVKPARRRQKI